jgi:hypothetical protein
VLGTARNGEVSLVWTAPAFNGGSRITDYLIQYSINGTSWTTFNDGMSTATSARVTGLTNGIGYVFRVAAVNVAGTGGYSAKSTSTTPAANPVTPTALTGSVSGSNRVYRFAAVNAASSTAAQPSINRAVVMGNARNATAFLAYSARNSPMGTKRG